MSAPEWRLLETLPDLPSAQALAGVLSAEGIRVRVVSDAWMLGQAAPSSIYVDAVQLYRARLSLEQRQFSDAELEELSALAQGAGEE
jgi:hypothetical protein